MLTLEIEMWATIRNVLQQNTLKLYKLNQKQMDEYFCSGILFKCNHLYFFNKVERENKTGTFIPIYTKTVLQGQWQKLGDNTCKNRRWKNNIKNVYVTFNLYHTLNRPEIGKMKNREAKQVNEK